MFNIPTVHVFVHRHRLRGMDILGKCSVTFSEGDIIVSSFLLLVHRECLKKAPNLKERISKSRLLLTQEAKSFLTELFIESGKYVHVGFTTNELSFTTVLIYTNGPILAN